MSHVKARRGVWVVALASLVTVAIGSTAYVVGGIKRVQAAPAIPLDGEFFHAKCWEVQHLEEKMLEAANTLQRAKGTGIDKARDELSHLKMQRNIEISRYNLEAKRAEDKRVLTNKGLPLQLNDGATTTSCQQ